MLNLYEKKDMKRETNKHSELLKKKNCSSRRLPRICLIQCSVSFLERKKTLFNFNLYLLYDQQFYKIINVIIKELVV